MTGSEGQPAPPERILIVGGGMSALTFAFWLTEQPAWSERFSITILQPGWRLGGKLASGRNREIGDRIEEHGLHVWSGFYENAFTVIQRVYAALGRSGEKPLATWDEAFAPWRDVSWAQRAGTSWSLLTNLVPGNSTVPGSGGMLTTPAGLLRRTVVFAARFLAGRLPNGPPGVQATGVRALLTKAALAVFAAVLAAERVIGSSLIAFLLRLLAPLIHLVRHTVHKMIDREHGPPGTLFEALVIVDLGLAYLEGFSHDHVFTRGFDELNAYELSDWLRRWHVHPQTLESGLVRGVYSYLFAFREGDTERPELEAGTALRMMLRLLLAGSTAIFWRMNAGAGDAVIAPLYELLERRGVEVRFFHRLRDVTLDQAGAMSAVEVGRQVTVKLDATGARHYRPLQPDGGGLQCWPIEPDYDQLEEGEQLKASGANLESYWTDWDDVQVETLSRGEDFDLLVWGASLATIPLLAPALIERSVPLRAAVHALPTVATQGLQIWLDPDTAALGGPNPATILTAYAEPFDTWADMSHLLGREDWPPIDPPGSLQYFCGVLALEEPQPRPPDPEYPCAVTAGVGEQGRRFLEHHAARLWPNVASRRHPHELRWRVLHASGSGDRFAEQFWRANIDPSERYVQSPVGSAAARPKPDATGIDGLLVIGDWVHTGLDYGCIEAAVMSALLAARAVCGSPAHVYGESDFPPFIGPVP